MSAIGLTVQLLRQGSTITSLVGNRIYPILIPQGADLPAIAVHLVYDEEEELLQGASQYPEGRVSIEIQHYSPAMVLDLGEYVIDWLRDKTFYPMTLAGVDYEVEFRKEGTDVTESDEGSICRRILDFYIRRRKT